MLKLITLMYDSPKFKITAAGTSSAYRTQESGIRQGWLLSPYLFVLFMSALFVDVKAQLSTPKQQEPIRGIRFADILYADDTLTFGTHTHSINKFLHAIQRESEYYNLQLNYDKCINLTLHQCILHAGGNIHVWVTPQFSAYRLGFGPWVPSWDQGLSPGLVAGG